jgi:transcriptional regulator of acetoin/glycerol metabolism
LVVLSNNNLIDVIDVHRWIEGNEQVVHGSNGKSNIRSEYQSEREKILEILGRTRFNKQKTANELGISRTTLWRKLKELNIET